jgi:hypothetical protein
VQGYGAHPDQAPGLRCHRRVVASPRTSRRYVVLVLPHEQAVAQTVQATFRAESIDLSGNHRITDSGLVSLGSPRAFHALRGTLSYEAWTFRRCSTERGDAHLEAASKAILRARLPREPVLTLHAKVSPLFVLSHRRALPVQPRLSHALGIRRSPNGPSSRVTPSRPPSRLHEVGAAPTQTSGTCAIRSPRLTCMAGGARYRTTRART